MWIYATKELRTPTRKTSKTHRPRPENTVPLFSVQPCGEANATGTPTTNRKDNAINANNVNWKRRVIVCKGVSNEGGCAKGEQLPNRARL